MTAFTVTVQDQAVKAALKNMASRIGNIDGALQTIGTKIIERTQHRFETSTAPDGTPWKPNSSATLGILTRRLSGQKGNVLKGGGLNKRGRASLANKKPLIGESQDLRRQFVAIANRGILVIASTPRYAGIQQFGSKAGRGLKVTIPARAGQTFSSPRHQTPEGCRNSVAAIRLCEGGKRLPMRVI